MSEIRGRLLVGGQLRPGTLRWERGRISSLDLESRPEAPASDLPVVAPGLIDLHVHGFGGFDPLADLHGMAHALARAGTTAFQPTLFPAAPEQLGQDAQAVWKEAQRTDGPAAARIVGIHLEGPFVNPRAAGALPIADLTPPSPEALRAILGSSTGDGRGIRTVTLAPELAGAADLVGEFARAGIRVSLGHSLATAAEARDAARQGACGATHLFNAMRPFHHRDEGLAGFALTDAALSAEIIGDLVHVGPDAFGLALKARGPSGLCLVSDALPGAGTGCEVFHWRGRDHLVKDGAVWHPSRIAGEDPRLAGSACSQLEMVRRLVQRGVVGLPEALSMASSTPARVLGLERELGGLRVGQWADLIVLEGPGLALREVRVAGEAV